MFYFFTVTSLALYAATQFAQHSLPSFATRFLHPQLKVDPQFEHFIFVGF
jgi:hypothetical protein